MQVSLSSTVTRAAGNLSSHIGDETVVLAPEAGEYFGLEGTGSRIWDLIETPTLVATVRDALVAEYEVDQEACESDLILFLENLSSAGLVEVTDSGSATP